MNTLSSEQKDRSIPQTVLTILHTNDFHGHLESWRGWEGELAGKTVGGFDRLATAIKQVRAQVPPQNLLLLDAGDALGDTLIADATKGRAILEVMNALRYDAMTLGNHEPDFTAEVLRERIRAARFPVLAANVIDTSNGQLFTKPYSIRPVAGIQVGILGLAYPNTPLTTAQKNVAGLEFQAGQEAARRFVPQLRQEGAQLIIVLSHLGLGADKKLAESVSGIDVIVGGHSHNRMGEALRVGDTLIVQAGAHGSDLGRLDLMLHNGRIIDYKRELIALDNAQLPADPAIAQLIKTLIAPQRGQLEASIGVAQTPISRAQTLAGQEAGKRDAQSPADSLFADILRAETGSAIALLPGVGYGVALQPGPFTAQDLRNLIPHHTKVVTLTLTGVQVREILEQSLENVYTDDPQRKVGGMIQVSGLQFRYDPQAPAFQRIQEITVGAEPLAPERRYQIATNALLAQGGHNYRTFLAGQDRQEHGEEYELVKSVLMRQKTISAPTDGRIHKDEKR